MQTLKNIKFVGFGLIYAAWLSLGLFVFSQPVAAQPAPEPYPCDNATTQQALAQCVKDNPIIKDIQLVVNVLSAGVGIVVVAMIVIGGIQYMMAGDNPQAVSAAKSRISNALIALAIFLFMAAFLQWLIPGGVFERTP